MRNLFYLLFVLLFISCSDNTPLEAPSDIAKLTAKPDTGSVVLTWDMPSDSSYLYIDVSYDKYPNSADTSEIIHKRASRYADSLVIDGLLHKYEYTFKVQPFNDNGDDKVGGNTIESEKVKPIRRPVKREYIEDDLTQIEGITPDMIDTHTQEPSEGPKENLLDDDINTYWHSAWSSGVEPLPHWVQFNFKEEQEVVTIKYTLRQTSDPSGFPTQFGLAVSQDGQDWERIWESEEELPYDPGDAVFTINLDKNHKAQYFRVLILKNQGGTNFVHLSTLKLFTMGLDKIDLEKKAEENY